MKKYLVILLVLSTSNVFAALNKWVDEKGNVHYSDQTPPANVKKTTLRFPPPPVSLTASSVSSTSPTATPTTPPTSSPVSPPPAEKPADQR